MIRKAVALWLPLTVVVSSAVAAPVPTDCDEGVYDLVNYAARPGDSMAESRASSTRFCLFEGDLTVDEFRSLGPDGQPVFHGVSLGHWNDDGDRETVLWLMVGDPGMTFLENRVEGDVLLSEGSGEDGLGPFDERSRRVWNDDGSSEFVMDRYYPRFERWIEPFNRIVKTPTERPVPEPPGEPHPLLARAGRLPTLGSKTAT